MAIHITASGSQNIINGAAGILVMCNAALTGTVTLADANGTFAVITNPAVGGYFVYTGTQGQITCNPSATCDLSISVLSRNTL